MEIYKFTSEFVEHFNQLVARFNFEKAVNECPDSQNQERIVSKPLVKEKVPIDYVSTVSFSKKAKFICHSSLKVLFQKTNCIYHVIKDKEIMNKTCLYFNPYHLVKNFEELKHAEHLPWVQSKYIEERKTNKYLQQIIAEIPDHFAVQPSL